MFTKLKKKIEEENQTELVIGIPPPQLPTPTHSRRASDCGVSTPGRSTCSEASDSDREQKPKKQPQGNLAENDNSRHKSSTSKRSAPTSADYEEIVHKLQLIKREKQELERQLRESEQRVELLAGRCENREEIESFQSQEMAKVKHLLLCSQQELRAADERLRQRSQELQQSRNRAAELEKGQRLSIAMTDFGARFGNEIARCCKSDESTIDETSAQNLKQRCQDFLYALLREVENRLPGNQQLFQGLAALHPSKVLSQIARFPFEHLPCRHLLEGEQDVLEQQYRKILMHVWAEESVFDSKVPDDCTLFWTGIFKYENAVGDRPYKELALYALASLSCPVSNAAVERVFSQVTCIKTKYRNKMSVKTLDAIVRIRTTLSLKSGCCVQFLVTDDMLRRFTSEMYDSVE
ncbi:hypothetical protein MTO96_050797 [Rhipicephalus appendiculatus]